MGSSQRIRRWLFGIADGETTFVQRGFPPCAPAPREHLESIGRTFVDGYHAALDSAPEPPFEALARHDPARRGWAFEGAAMAMALLDRLVPGSGGRGARLLEGEGDRHVYMIHVGFGWAWARLRRRPDRLLPTVDPLLGWLAVDGYGFHEGYFHWRACYEQLLRPARLTGYAERVFDQGLGRCLWFVGGTDVERIRGMVGRFPAERHADLWSGLGLACAYAGGVPETDLVDLRDASGPFRDHLAQGTAFAAKARERAGAATDHTDLAVRTVCGLSSTQAARITDDALQDLGIGSGEPAYPPFEVWRQRIRQTLVPTEAAA